MYYGIDLGTTNSLIGNGENLFTGLVSSSVNIATGQQVDRNQFGEDIVSSYKVNMSTGKEGQLSIKASSIILKDLVNKANMKTGSWSRDVVISVPAKFSSTQRSAVAEAAKIAGLNLKGLINEPTAAALYVCREMKDLVIVYDLGGGTFDISVLDSRIGLYTVVASDGRILAGDDFDEALMDGAIKERNIKIRLRSEKNMSHFKTLMRNAKETLQLQRCTQYVDMSMFGESKPYELTVDTYVETMKNVFRETIDLTEYVLRGNVPECEKPKIVFVGGSTACPYLRDWVSKSLGLEVYGCDINPDLLVAKGVALYAEMLEQGKVEELVEDVTRRLCIEDKSGRAKTIIEKNSIIPIKSSIQVTNNKKSRYLELRLYQGDCLLASENEYIGTLVYDYGCEMEAGEGYIEVEVKVDRNGIVTLKGIDILTGIEQDITLTMR
jgi:molecular chaperone DnaK (HSP70)